MGVLLLLNLEHTLVAINAQPRLMCYNSALMTECDPVTG